MKRLALGFGMLTIASLLLSACATPTPETIVEEVVVKETVVVEGETEVVERVVTATPEPTEEEKTTKHGGTLTIQVDGMVQFDYAQCADDNSWYVISNVFSTLYRISENRDIYPDMATSWEYEDDTTLILHLREGVMWQDGNDVFPEGESREVVAEDVAYSIRRGVELEGSTLSAGFLGAFESVEVLDDHTVQLNLNKPDALLMSGSRGLGHIAVVPKEAVEQLGEDFGLNPIGSGPFEFVEYMPDEKVVLKPNEDYWKEPYLDEVIFRIIPDQDAALIAFENGEVDRLAVVPEEEVDRLKDDTRFILKTGGYQCAPWIMFDMTVPLFQDPKLRQALAYALDGEGISRSIEGSLYTGGCGIAGKGVPGYDPNLCQYFPYDPDEAQALLSELGWADTNGDGVLDKDGDPLEFQMEIWSMGNMPEYGEAIIVQWREIGIGAELQTVEFGTWIDDLFAGPEKAMMASGFCTDGGLNGVFGRNAATAQALSYDIPEVYDLLDEANVTVNATERDEILRQAQERLFSQYLAIPMRHRTTFSAVRSRVHDFPQMFWTTNICTEENNVWVTD